MAPDFYKARTPMNCSANAFAGSEAKRGWML
jgi:hypothetical protein